MQLTNLLPAHLDVGAVKFKSKPTRFQVLDSEKYPRLVWLKTHFLRRRTYLLDREGKLWASSGEVLSTLGHHAHRRLPEPGNQWTVTFFEVGGDGITQQANVELEKDPELRDLERRAMGMLPGDSPTALRTALGKAQRRWPWTAEIIKFLEGRVQVIDKMIPLLN